ncbi:hypothetical protein BH23BAC1_BH23BAC1_10310 [soil metagenome]
MKKLLLSSIFLLLLSTAYSQHRIGLRFSPTLSVNRIDSDSERVDYSSNGVGARFIFGPTFDYFLGENYYISTGLLYAPKRAGISGIVHDTRRRVDERYNLQYLQIPATLKLYTNELALDTRLYFQLGGLIEFKIADRAAQTDIFLVDRFRPYDFSTLLGTGVEYRIGVNTVVYGGISYVRGLLNAATRQTGNPIFDQFTLKNDLLTLDLGIMF